MKRAVARRPAQPSRQEDGAERRRSPRTDVDQLGVVESPAYRDPLISFPIRVSSVAPRGLGIEIDGGGAAQLDVGDSIVIRFGVADAPLALPGRVAWLRRDRGLVCAGVALQLEVAGARSRQSYAEWVVRRISERAR